MKKTGIGQHYKRLVDEWDIEVTALEKKTGISHKSFYNFFKDSPSVTNKLSEQIITAIQEALANAINGGAKGERDQISMRVNEIANIIKRLPDDLQIFIRKHAEDIESAYLKLYEKRKV